MAPAAAPRLISADYVRTTTPRYYPGKIAKVNGNGTCDVDYDDGEKEADVAEALIRKVEAAAAPAAAAESALSVGAVVEARYRGKSKHAARAEQSRRDGRRRGGAATRRP